MLENERSLQLTKKAERAFRRWMRGDRYNKWPSLQEKVYDEDGVETDLTEGEVLTSFLTDGNVLAVAKLAMKRSKFPIIALEVIEHEYGYSYSSSILNPQERRERRRNDVRAILDMEEFLLPEEIKSVTQLRQTHEDTLGRTIGYPDSKLWGVSELLSFTMEGIKSVKVEEKINRTIQEASQGLQEAIQGLSGLSREDWMRIVTDIQQEGVTTRRLEVLGEPLHRAEILRREFMREITLVFYDKFYMVEEPDKKALLSAIKSFKPVSLYSSRFDLDPQFDARFLGLSSQQLEREFNKQGYPKYPLLYYAKIRRIGTD